MRVRARKLKQSPYEKDPQYFDCPTIGCKGAVYMWGIDIAGRRVYQCRVCEHKFGAPTLDFEAKQRRMRD